MPKLTETFQTLALNIPGIVYRVNLKGQKENMEFFNDMLQHMTGYRAAELVRGEVCSIDPIIISEDRSYVIEVVQDAVSGNKLFEVEYRIRHKDGSIRYFLERGRPVYGSDGKPAFIDGIILDISERKQLEQALVLKEHIIENSSSVIATCDLEGNMTYGNPSFLKKWGFDNSEDFLGKPFWEFWSVKDRLDEIMQALRDKGFWFGEIKAMRKDGTIFDVQVSAAMVFDGGGNPTALTSTSIDITERKQAEEELRRSRNELELRVRERTAELERRNQELQEFAFVASHDLSEPLRKIQTFGSFLSAKKADRLDDEGKDYVLRMTGAANRMQELLNALLSYSRLETKVQEFKPVRLNDVVRDAVGELELASRKIGARVEIATLPTVLGDPNQLRQLFQNLIANSLKYHRPAVKTVIKIYGEEENGRDRVSVEDNGIGFDQKYLDKIFQPFQRLHGKHEYPGTGIGLAICKKIVERHGGTITAKSTPGEGSTFIVAFPVIPNEHVGRE